MSSPNASVDPVDGGGRAEQLGQRRRRGQGVTGGVIHLQGAVHTLDDEPIADTERHVGRLEREVRAGVDPGAREPLVGMGLSVEPDGAAGAGDREIAGRGNVRGRDALRGLGAGGLRAEILLLARPGLWVRAFIEIAARRLREVRLMDAGDLRRRHVADARRLRGDDRRRAHDGEDEGGRCAEDGDAANGARRRVGGMRGRVGHGPVSLCTPGSRASISANRFGASRAPSTGVFGRSP